MTKGKVMFGIVAVAVLLLWMRLTKGLPDDVRSGAEEAQQAVEATLASVAEAKTGLEAVVEKDKDYLDPQEVVTAARKLYEQRKADLEAVVAKEGAELAPLLEEDDYDDREEVAALTARLTEVVGAGSADLDKPVEETAKILSYKVGYEDNVGNARKHLAAAELVLNDQGLEAGVVKAAAAFPAKAEDLNKRFAAVKELATGIKADGAKLEEATTKVPPDYVTASSIAEAIAPRSADLETKRAAVDSAVDSVGRSLDKILVDMKEEKGKYFHKYKVVKDGKAGKPKWEEVTWEVYSKHKDHLGMAIYSKPLGKYGDEATEVAAPPGMEYVDNSEYGEWDGDGDDAAWRWYPRYAYMGALYWGAGYRPIHRNVYVTYRTSIRAGRVYYGVHRQYGTRGSLTQKRYGRSTFYKRRKAAERKAKRAARRSRARSRGRRGK